MNTHASNTSGVDQQNPTDSHVLILLGTINGKLDAALQQIAKHEEDQAELQSRVSKLENLRSRLYGLVAGASAAGGVIGGGSSILLSTLGGG